MSLAGRLEDLSLGDILQIVYLSRRSGTIEIRDGDQLTVLAIRKGLIVAAGTPGCPDLPTYLGTLGETVLSGGLSSDLIRSWIASAVTPLVAVPRGEFRFVLTEPAAAADLGYDPDSVASGGFSPQTFLASPEVKPLAGLEERIKAGSDFLRGGTPRSADQKQTLAERLFTAPPSPDQAVPSDPFVDPRTGALVGEPRFTVREQSAGVGAAVVVFEPDARVRVALRRTLSADGHEVRQFSSLEETRSEVEKLIDDRRFFVTVADVLNEKRSVGLLRLVKEANHRLPIAILFGDFDVAAAIPSFDPHSDLVVPESAAVWKDPSAVLRRLSSFASAAMSEWDGLNGSVADRQAGSRFYDAARRELIDRRCELLENLITELSADQSTQSVAQILLRVASEYLDRGAVFLEEGQSFVGAAGFGPSGDGDELNERVRAIRIAREAPSVLNDVRESGRSHRGKLRRTEANAALISKLGSAQPTDVAVFPIGTGERLAGLFYGDNGVHRSPMRELGALEVFLSQAGRALEAGQRAHEDALDQEQA